MPLISMRQLLDDTAEHGYGVPAFNVNNLEQIQAIMQAANETSSRVIMQASAGARKYAGEPFLRHLILAAIEGFPELPIVVNQDHGASPASFEHNVAVTRRVVEMAHPVGVSVEGELYGLGSLETLTAGNAGKIKAVSMEMMADRYAKAA